MSFNPFSAITAALTPAGTHAAASQGNRQSQIGKTYGNLFDQLAPQYGDALKLIGNLHASGAIGNALNGLNQDPSQRVGQFGAGANEAATKAAAAQSNFLRSQGIGDGGQQGAAAGLFQNAATQTNQYAQQQMSPEVQQQYINAVLQALQGVFGTYGNGLAGLSSGVYGQPQVQVQQNPFAALLGQAAGAYTSGLGAKAAR